MTAAFGASPLSRSLAIQSRVIGALLLREMLTRYGRHNIGFLWLFLEPMLFVLAITAIFTLVRTAHSSDIPIVAFAVTGYSSVLLWRNIPGRCINAVEPNLALMYHRHVKVIDIFLARILLEIAGSTTSFVTLVLAFNALAWMPAPEDLFKIILAWLLLAWFGAALGLLIGALSSRTELVQKIWSPINLILFLLSGAMFMVDWLPPAAQQWILLLPMVHGVELLREGYFGSIVHAHYDVAYLATSCLVLTLLGLAQERIISRGVIPQ